MSHGQAKPSSEEKANGVSIAARTCAVIVTYFPDCDVPARARLIAGQVGAVIVVDNGSGPDHDDALLCLSEISNLTLLRNDTNLGLAAALNQGLRLAKDQGNEWALLFDQDTTPFESMVSELDLICRELGRDSRATLLGSNFIDINNRRAWLNPADFPNQEWVESKYMTTSGTLLPLAAFDALGSFREDFFVDFIDMEYGLRARSQGYRVATSVRPLMLHTVGARTTRRLLWKTVWPSNHSPLRRYLMARNLVILVREYGRRDPAWALRTTKLFVNSLILVLFFEDRKLRKLEFVARGVIAGWKGRTGNDFLCNQT